MPQPMTLLSIDPGNIQSAFVVLENGIPTDSGKVPNLELLRFVRQWHDCMVIEGMQYMNRKVGHEVFDTCEWIGRFKEAHQGTSCDTLLRTQVKGHICGTCQAHDSDVRKALILRFGGDKAIKKGGPLYGIKADEWSALAIGLTYLDKQRGEVSA